MVYIWRRPLIVKISALTHFPERFFRDSAGLTVLLRAVRLLPEPAPQAAIRLWVPSNSTGEDAYSTAMAFLDGLKRARRRCRVRVLATGPDARTIKRARRAIYSERISEQMTGARL